MTMLPSIYLALLVTGVTSILPSITSTLPKPIIVDTDLFSDVDDIGALAIANSLHNCGLADLQAVVINTQSEYGSLAASAITTHFSNPSIPIAARRPLTKNTFHDTRHYRLGEYASKLAHIHNFPRALQNAALTPEPVDLYRQTLAAAPKNTSITLVSIGFLTNLAALLESGPDNISPLTGIDLVKQQVAELVIMGGSYPSGLEFNFAFDVASTRAVLTKWPDSVPTTFSGYELGSRIFSGQSLPALADEGSPVLAAYQWYGDRCDTRRASYDPVTVLYAVMGLEGGMFEFEGEGGWNEVGEDGRNWWVWGEGNGKKQRWLKLKAGVSEEDVGGIVERLYVRGSLDEQCCLDLGACEGSMKVQFPLKM